MKWYPLPFSREISKFFRSHARYSQQGGVIGLGHGGQTGLPHRGKGFRRNFRHAGQLLQGLAASGLGKTS